MKNRDFTYKGIKFHLNDNWNGANREFEGKYWLMWWNEPYERWQSLIKEEAMEILHKMVNEWCDNHDVDVLDTDYDEGDESFCYGEEEEGVCAIVIYEIPLITNDVDQYLWEAKMEAEKANYASEDYKWTLQDCDVDIHITRIEEYIDKVMELVMDGWKYEEK